MRAQEKVSTQPSTALHKIRMELQVNHKRIEFPDQASLADVLEHIHINAQQGVAVAVNEKVISRQELSKHILNQNDRILIIQAAQGG